MLPGSLARVGNVPSGKTLAAGGESPAPAAAPSSAGGRDVSGRGAGGRGDGGRSILGGWALPQPQRRFGSYGNHEEMLMLK